MTRKELETLTRVAIADVYKRGRLAANLRRSPDGIEFAYRKEYLHAGGRAVATTLPLADTPVRTQAGAVPPFFAGLLPEGRRLASLRRAVKTSADDELSLLLAVGHDTIGDVQIVPQGVDPVPAKALLQVSADWSEVTFAELLSEAGVVDSVGLPGVQDKVSARMISVPVARAGERYLLKLDPPEYPHLVRNEAFFLDVARKARVEAVKARVVHDAQGTPGLLVLRFDRVPGPDGASQSLACEDACQVLGRWPADKYLVTYEDTVTALADRCAARPVALRALYRQICFAWLTGNGDVHAKNLSILRVNDEEWRVSPAYDLPSTVPYGDRSLALTLGGRDRGLSRSHLLQFAGTIGIGDRVGAGVLDDVLQRLEGLEAMIRGGALPFPEKMNNDIAAEIRYRRRLARGDTAG